MSAARLGYVEGWVVTEDGETIKSGLASQLEAAKWLHRRQSQSVDWAVRHAGYDIVLVEGGKVKWSYKRDVLGAEKKGRKKGGKNLGMAGAKDWDPRNPWSSEDFEAFFRQYIATALWAESDPDTGSSLDSEYSIEDIDREALSTLRTEAEEFLQNNWDDVKSDLEQAGHDFWLTRNGHGAGFWDGDWPKKVGKRLTEASKAYGEITLYVGDDGKIHV